MGSLLFKWDSGKPDPNTGAYFPTPHATSHIEGAEYDEIRAPLNQLAYPMRGGLLDDRPPFGNPGFFYYAIDKGILYRDTGAAWQIVSVTKFPDLASLKGSSNPTSPTTGDLFFRSDKQTWVVYDGTRWLACSELCASRAELSYSAAGQNLIEKLRNDYAPYLTRVSLLTKVATTNDASNYWTITLRGANAAYSATTNIHQITTAAHTAGAWVESDAAPSLTATPSNHALLDVSVSKTGSPGALSLNLSAFYKLIVS